MLIASLIGLVAVGILALTVSGGCFGLCGTPDKDSQVTDPKRDFNH